MGDPQGGLSPGPGDLNGDCLRAMEHLPDPILFLDPELKITWVNRAAAARVESDPEELLGKHCFCLWTGGQEPCEGCPAVRAGGSGEPSAGEVVLSNGEYWLVNAVPLLDDSGTVRRILVTARDRTPTRSLEKRLTDERAHFEQTLENLPDGVFVHDLSGDLILVNRAACDLTGYTSKELLAMKVWEIDADIVERDDPGRIWHELKTGECVRVDAVHRRKDGSTYPVGVHISRTLLDGQPVMLGVARDQTREREAEQTLRHREARITSLFESVHAGIVLQSASGEILRVNQTASEILGMHAEDITGRTSEDPAWEMIDENGTPVAGKDHPAMITMRTGRPLRNQLRGLFTGDPARTKWLLINTEPLLTDDGDVSEVLATFMDITELRRAEEGLSHSLEELELTLETTTSGLWNWWFEEDRMVFSPQYYTMLGYEPDAFPPSYEQWLELVHEQDRPQARAQAEEWLEHKTGEYRNTFRLQAKDGTFRWVEAKGKVVQRDAAGAAIRMIGTHEDVTSEREMLESLRASEERFRNLAESMPDHVMLLDEQLRITYLNFTSPGVEKADVLGRYLYALGGGDSERVKNILENVRDTGEPASYETSLPTAEVTIYYESKAVRMRLGEARVLVVSRDITEFRSAEAERERLRDQLAQMQKIESIGRLAGGIAHDFNNKLQSILGFASLAMEEAGCSDEVRSSLMEVHKAAESSADLTRQLLTFARKQTIQPSILDLNTSIENLLRMLRRLIGEDIELVWKPAPEVWPVLLDPTQLDQMLANLLVNARDALQGTGKLTIDTGNARVDTEDALLPPGSVPGDYAFFSVTDTGCGMEEEVRGHIFEPFFTTKPTGEGTGLGLSMVYGAVMQNGGFITVESQPDKGTSIRIHLPRCRSEVLAAEMRGGEPPQGEGETVLVVEDEQSLLTLCVLLLEQLGYKVLKASSPREALSLMESYEAPVDLLLVDVVMPEMTGKDLAAELVDKHPSMRTLFMSGYTADVIADRGVLDDDVNFIQKPFTQSDLAWKLRQVLDRD